MIYLQKEFPDLGLDKSVTVDLVPTWDGRIMGCRVDTSPGITKS